MTNPLVSVIIPAYNAERSIGAAVSSCLMQTYDRIQVIVVDDGSTDNTAGVVAAYGPDVTLVRQDNQGPNAARNRGVAEAGGDYIALCDADDLLFPHHVSSSVPQVSAREKVWVASAALLVGDRGLFRHGNSWKPVPFGAQVPAILQENFVPLFGIFPRSMYADVGGFSESLRRCEDWDFWARAILSGWNVRINREPGALVYVRPGSNSSDFTLMFRDEEKMLSSLYADYEQALDAASRRYVTRRLTLGSPRRHRHEADVALTNGDLADAVRRYALAAGLWPRNRRLRWKARLLNVAPATAHLWRRRLGRGRSSAVER